MAAAPSKRLIAPFSVSFSFPFFLVDVVFIIFLPSASSQNPVCQLYSEPDTPLQDILAVECNVSTGGCECESSYLESFHPEWKVMTPRTLPAMGKLTPPGYFLPVDKDGNCMATFGPNLMTSILSCLPGFYCEGGLNPPKTCNNGDHCPGGTTAEHRRCPEGYFCPFPAAPLMDCMQGAVCHAGSTAPTSCDAGFFCTEGIAFQCPSGYYCPLASVKPQKCGALKLCPRGSTHEDSAPMALALALVGTAVMIVGSYLYEVFVQSAKLVSSMLMLLILTIWLMDHIIGGFLMLQFLAILINYLMFRYCQCPPLAAQGLTAVTFMTGLFVLYEMDPAWALLLAGLGLIFVVSWLLSRNSPNARFAGRLVLVSLLGVLLFFFARLDFVALLYYVIAIVCTLVYYIGAWVVSEKLRPGEEMPPWLRRGARVFSPCQDVMASEATTALSRSMSEPLAIEEGARLPGAPVRPAAPTERARSSTPAATQRKSAPSGGSSPDVPGGVSFLLEDVNFRLNDGTLLLKDINLGIRPGRRVAVMGASGSGKSTLLAVLSGSASYGKIDGTMKICGYDSTDPPNLQAVTGFVPQDDILHGELSVAENIRFQAKLRLPASSSEQPILESVDEVIEELNLSHIRHARVGTPEARGISGGQRKRVSIAMEQVTKPRLLFADEPTSGLDSTTAHDVVGCMNSSALRLRTTVICVIHQPSYKTLLLFDDLVLLATGGVLVYSGPAEYAKEGFQRHLDTYFEPNTNPADSFLDELQQNIPSQGALRRLQEYGFVADCRHIPPVRESEFTRDRVPFFKAVLIFLDRSMLQTMRAYSVVIINQFLSVVVMIVLTSIVPNTNFDKYFMQSSFACLFLMLLQGVAAHRVFGPDLLITLREARVGMSLIAYIAAKDIAALFEITLSAAIFAASWGTLSGVQQSISRIFSGAWAFIYCVYGIGYIFSICLSQGAAQMSMVVAGFISFCVCGTSTPTLPQLARLAGGRGWLIPGLSPVRWLWGYLLTGEMEQITPLARQYGHGPIEWRGYDMNFLGSNMYDGIRSEYGIISLRDAWQANRGWVTNTENLLLLGVMFRFVTGISMILYIYAHTSKFAQFFGQSDKGYKKLFGKLFTVLAVYFVLMLFWCEAWIFGIIKIDMHQFIKAMRGL
eukprot:CAMPEP_0206546060 /NCGR_PEP_ID=MMETSP0325_2-20121206/12486_1 /ASSEMBLY_ACC=CAM_ASM_000347 /TAXON_ID=2866 /ORGANISM="Crypthecodinium cohnii, Strain Seligo" /LENGTH=1144 /DNA_ID=CAMNT_0054045123 /DNA_START=389 /DNA_END=3823 /DNA_ORIENTATION=-